MKKERIDKLIAGSGKLSRKDVAGLISHGNVTLNGRTVKSGSEKADADSDEIKVCGEIFTIKKHIYIMLNKPRALFRQATERVKEPFVTLSPRSLCAVGCSRPADSIKILRALC